MLVRRDPVGFIEWAFTDLSFQVTLARCPTRHGQTARTPSQRSSPATPITEESCHGCVCVEDAVSAWPSADSRVISFPANVCLLARALARTTLARVTTSAAVHPRLISMRCRSTTEERVRRHSPSSLRPSTPATDGRTARPRLLCTMNQSRSRVSGAYFKGLQISEADWFRLEDIWHGSVNQESASVITLTDDTSYDGRGYTTFGVEYDPGPDVSTRCSMESRAILMRSS